MKPGKYLITITTQFVFGLSLSLSLSLSAMAATEVMDLNEVSNADANALSEDAKIFNTISLGIALSIAQCEGRENCEPGVDESEIEQLIEALDKRIEGVVTRQQNSEEDLENVITAYVDTREKYTDYMEKLNEFAKSAEPELPEDEFVEEDVFTNEDAMTEDEFSAFEDFDDSLQDDASLQEDLPEDEFGDELDAENP